MYLCMFALGAGCLMECNRKMYIMEQCLQGRLCRKRAVLCNNKMPKAVSVGCVGLWKHNGVLSEFGKIRETGKMCHVMSIDE